MSTRRSLRTRRPTRGLWCALGRSGCWPLVATGGPLRYYKTKATREEARKALQAVLDAATHLKIEMRSMSDEER